MYSMIHIHHMIHVQCTSHDTCIYHMMTPLPIACHMWWACITNNAGMHVTVILWNAIPTQAN